ncbi:hypothetical protein ACIQ6V_06780 [Streptomyces sp. NPDC096198]|uniref:hypothetical protein n=1 Tax=Streptomyces sp. NPDC096198 TaxID=3366080 RepID=UPI0038122EDD
MLVAQGGLHLLFHLSHTVRPHHADMVMHGMRMAHTQAHALTPHATAAHVGAAVVLTWWLRRGEAAVWSLLRRAAGCAPGLAAWWQTCTGARAIPDALGIVRRVVEKREALRGARLRYAVRRRGPPTGTPYAIHP